VPVVSAPEAPTATRTLRRPDGPRRAALVVLLLLAALLTGYGIGRISRPAAAPTTPPTAGMHAGHPSGAPDDGHDHSADGGDSGAGGLSASLAGFTLAVDTPTFTAGVRQKLAFRIVGRDGAPVKSFEVVHDKRLHLVVVRADLSGYQHLHPDLAPDGTWSIQLTLPTGGTWRMYADFAAKNSSGRQIAATLAANLAATGAYQPVALPAPATNATVDRHTVMYEGTPQVGATTPLLVRISPAVTLDRYLGAYGHLVVLRETDLAYLHVHPEEQLSGGAVKFWLAAPSPGRYRAFFDFSIGGTVRTAEFTMQVG